MIDLTPLLLKKWTPLFNASKERMNVMSIWVRLPGRSTQLWTELSFKELGNAMGTFMDVDMSFKETSKMSYGQNSGSIGC
jgi:hypothetical protein